MNARRRRVIGTILRRFVQEYSVVERDGRWHLRDRETGLLVDGVSDETKVLAETRARDEVAKALDALWPGEGETP